QLGIFTLKNSGFVCHLHGWSLLGRDMAADKACLALGGPFAYTSQSISSYTTTWLRQSGRPVTPNKNERVWQDLPANVTRNHRCAGMKPLLAEVRYYLRKRNRKKLHRAIAA